VPADGAVVGRIMKANAAPVDEPWLWTLAFGHHEDRTPTHGYAATREGRDGGIGGGSKAFLTLRVKQAKIDGL
jgi:hypothetical protein